MPGLKNLGSRTVKITSLQAERRCRYGGDFLDEDDNHDDIDDNDADEGFS